MCSNNHVFFRSFIVVVVVSSNVMKLWGACFVFIQLTWFAKLKPISVCLKIHHFTNQLYTQKKYKFKHFYLHIAFSAELNFKKPAFFSSSLPLLMWYCVYVFFFASVRYNKIQRPVHVSLSHFFNWMWKRMKI